MQEAAKTTGQIMQSLTIVQLVASIFLKGAIADLMSCLFILQMTCFLSTYSTIMPPNTEVYVVEFTKLVNFEALKPDSLLKTINPEWSKEYIKYRF